MTEQATVTEEATLCARFEQAMGGANADPHLVWRGRTLTADCIIGIGSARYLLRIEAGRVAACTRQIPLLCSTEFVLKGTPAAWSALWQRVPPAGWHDVFALTKRREMSIEGNMQPVMANLQYLKDLLALPREGAVRE